MKLQFEVVKETIEKVTVTGSMANFEEAEEWLFTNGYKVTRSGTLRVIAGSSYVFDPDKFSITAEKTSLEHRCLVIKEK